MNRHNLFRKLQKTNRSQNRRHVLKIKILILKVKKKMNILPHLAHFFGLFCMGFLVGLAVVVVLVVVVVVVTKGVRSDFFKADGAMMGLTIPDEGAKFFRNCFHTQKGYGSQRN